MAIIANERSALGTHAHALSPDGKRIAVTTPSGVALIPVALPLADIQVSVVGEAGKRYLVVARYVEAKLAQAEISAGLRPAIQDGPTVTMLDQVDDLRGANADLDRAEGFPVAFIGNSDLVRSLPVANDGAVEAVVVHLKEDVVRGVGVVEYPLQEATLGRHRGKNKRA